MSPKLHLVVQLYKAVDPSVLERMVLCITSNLNLRCIGALTVVCENINLNIDSPKARVKNIKKRATYADLLRIASEPVDESITHYALANTDIYLTDDIEGLMIALDRPEHAAAISRHEANGELYPEPKWSQDVWVFKQHSPSGKVLASCSYQLGVAGCEHLFAMALHAHGYNIWNPCVDCKILHADPNPRFAFSQRYQGAYLYLPPCCIKDVGVNDPEYQLAISRCAFGESPSGSAATGTATAEPG